MDELKLSVADAAYIAGIIDGEGTITLTRKHRNENRQLAVTISSNERYLLEFIRQAIGAGKITNKRTIKAEHAPHFTYSISNRQALALLHQIAPYLRTYKRDRAMLILQEYLRLTPRNGYYTDQMRVERQQFEQRLLSIKPNLTTLSVQTN